MVDFLHFCRRAARVVLPLAMLGAVSCGHEDTSPVFPENTISVPVSVDLPETRAFTDGQTHRVNRILVLPFRKSAENLPDDNANYLPAYDYAEQIDVAQFPVGYTMLQLPIDVTYKVMIIGYNQSDYDFNDQGNPGNRFDIGAVSSPVTLANFHLSPKSPAIVPEFFTCLAQVYNENTLVGTTFSPKQGYIIRGNLKRLVSGFSITVNNVPAFVESMTLSAENLVKSSRAVDAGITQWQTAGDGGERVLAKQTPAGGTVTFSNYLLPTFETNMTGFTIAVEFGSTIQNYTVKAPDSDVVSGNKFIFNPNEAINLTGDYSSINIGFSVSYGINLDDDQWDGIQ